MPNPYLSRLGPVLCGGLLVATPVIAAGEKTFDTITVTSTLDDVAERRESAAQKVIVTKQDIEAMGVLTIGDVMGKLPGVDAGTPGADGSMALRSRGMVRDSVQILVDGERVHHNARVAQGIVGRLPSTELLRVEIIRGSSAEVGGSAPLTVNLVLAKPLSRDSTAVKAAVGLRGDRPIAQTNFTKGGGDKSFSWLLPITLNHHEMPSARDTLRRDSTGLWQEDSEQGDRRTTEFVVSPRLTWKAGRDNLTLNPVLFRSFGPSENVFERTDLVVPTGSATRSDSTESRNAFNRLRADAELYRRNIKYSGRLNVSDGERRADTRRNGITAGGLVTLADEHTRRKERDYGGSLRADWNSGAHVLAAALEHATHRRDEYQSNSSLGFDETHEGRDRQTSLWLQDEWGISPSTTITGGVRGEFSSSSISLRGQDSDKTLILVDGLRRTEKYVGANLNNIQLEDIERIEIVRGPMSALYGSDALGGVINIITRGPRKGSDAGARFMAGQTGDGQRDTAILGGYDLRGNPDLQPEESTSGEIAVAYRLDRGQMEIVAHRSNVTNLIASVPTGARGPGCGPGPTSCQIQEQQNIGKAIISGVEFSGSYRLADAWTLGGSLEYLDAMNAITDTRLTDRPTWTAKLNLQWQLGPWQTDLRLRHVRDWYPAAHPLFLSIDRHRRQGGTG